MRAERNLIRFALVLGLALVLPGEAAGLTGESEGPPWGRGLANTQWPPPRMPVMRTKMVVNFMVDIDEDGSLCVKNRGSRYG